MSERKVKRISSPLVVLGLLLFVIIISNAYAGNETFTVPPLNEVVRTVHLTEGEKVSGSITVTGGSGNDIDFYVTNPDGNTILRYDRATFYFLVIVIAVVVVVLAVIGVLSRRKKTLSPEQ